MGSVSGTTNLEIKLTTTGAEQAAQGVAVPTQELQKLREAAQQTQAATESMASSMETLKKIGEAWGLAEILKEIGAAFGEANAEANRLVTTLIAVTGSLQAAKAAYEDIHEVVRSSGQTTDDVTQSWIRLHNIGIQPTVELLKALSGAALVTDRDITTVTNAFAMAAEGHARGLAQLGIEAKDVGDKVLVSFQGQQQVIEKTKQGIEEYILSIGQTPAAIDAMNAKLNTSAGAWDQLKKAAGDLFETLGGGGSGKVGWFTSAEQGATSFIDKLNAIIQRYGVLTGVGALQAYTNGRLGEFEVLAESAKRANEELAKQTGLVDQLKSEWVDLFARLSGYSGTTQQALSGLASLWQGLKNIPAQVEAEIAKESKSADDWAKQLDKHTIALGQNMEAQARYRTTVGDLAHASDEEKDKVLEAARAYDAKTASVKSAHEEEQRYKAGNEIIQRLQDEIDAIGHTQEYTKYLTELREAETRAAQSQVAQIRELAAARYDEARAKAEADLLTKTNESDSRSIDKQIADNERIVKAYHDTVSALNLVDEAQAKYEKGVQALQDMLKLHPEMLDQITEAEKRLLQQRDDAITGMDKYREAEHQLRDQIAGDLSTQFADFMVNGFQDGGKRILDLQKSLAKQLTEFWLKEKIIIPFEQQLKTTGGGDAGGMSNLGTGIAVGGMVVGGAVGGQAGGAISGAASGFMVGNQIYPGIGGIVGAVIGGIAGWLGSSDKKPQMSLYGTTNHSGTFTDNLGTFGLDTRDMSQSSISQWLAQLEQFDNALAALLPADQVDRVTASIHKINKSYTDADIDKAMRDRLDAAISVIAPQWKAFIDKLSGAQQMTAALEGLLKLQEEIKNFNDVIVQLAGSPIDKIANQMEQLDRAVNDAQGKLDTALKTQDPTAILSAEQTLKQAIISRYQQEMQMLAQVQQAISQLEASSYSLNYSIASKIASINGDFSGMINESADRMSQLRTQYEGSVDPAEQIGLLNEFTGALDNWLSSSIQAVNSALQSQLDALDAQKQSINDDLNSQIQDIENQKTAEQQRAQASAQNSQALAAAEQSARQAQISDLQKQLQLANQWASVLDNAEKTIQSLTTSSSNPLGPYSQLDNLESIIANRVSAVRSESGDQQAKDAAQLITDLQQRLQLIQSGNLYQRSSPEYLEQYNRTLAQLAEVQRLSGTKASQADLLQMQLDALQRISTAISGGGAQTNGLLNTLNAREQELKDEAAKKLSDINKTEDDLKKQAKEQIDKLNKEALEYYTWVRGEAQKAEQKRHDELIAQLKAITGGLDPQSFIAQETAREVDLLNSIDKNLKAFLDSISSQTGTGNTGKGGGGGGGGGGGSKNPNANADAAMMNTPVNIHVTTTVNGTGMGSQEIAEAVTNGLQDALPRAIPYLKRELKVA